MVKICILLSTYNGEKYLGEQLDSLFAQTYENFEILVRDDGSNDKTMEIIKSFQDRYPSQIKILKDSFGNIGSAYSFMRLLEGSNSEYFMFCDQDDVWMKDKIKHSVQKMQELEEKYAKDIPLMVFSDLRVVDEKLNTVDMSFWHYQKLSPEISKNQKKLLAQNVITGCTVMINKEAKYVSLPFAVDTMMHDHWIGVNVAKYGKIAWLPEQTVLYRQHSANVAGAHRFGVVYVAQKMLNLINIFKKQKRVVKHFKNVTIFELIFWKIQINIKRLLERQ
ncbi:MAG: hypothetical protein QG565_776 [Campylobacterota bacterium]|nr:hypothetical protein [Campylobacterota bacterium]